MMRNPSFCSLGSCEFAISHRHHARVVVVGSSSEVLDTALGHIVDRHDTIVRCNCAPTLGLEHHVGSRTSFRVVNEQSEAWLSSPEPTATLVAIPIAIANHSSFGHNSNMMKHLGCRVDSPSTNNRPVFVTYDFNMRLRAEFGVTHPTIGFTAIALFSQLFTRPVSLHGFSFFKNGTKHYWWNHSFSDLCGKNKLNMASAHANANTYHNSSLERDIILRHAERGIVSFLSERRGAGTGGMRHEPHESSGAAASLIGGRGAGNRTGHHETCLSACRESWSSDTAAGERASCRWKEVAHTLGPMSGASGRGDSIRTSNSKLLSTGCMPPPYLACCYNFLNAPRHLLYRRRANNTFALVSRGRCYRGHYRGFREDAEIYRSNLTACLSLCASEDRCHYAAWRSGLTCSRFDARAGITCCPDADAVLPLLGGAPPQRGRGNQSSGAASAVGRSGQAHGSHGNHSPGTGGGRTGHAAVE